MKKNNLYIVALVCGVWLAGSSCSEDLEYNTPAGDVYELEFDVNIPGQPVTRAIITDDTQSDDWGSLPGDDPRKKFPIKTSFQAGQDALYLFEDDVVGQRGIFTATQSGENTTFKGQFQGTPSKTSVIALYPVGSYGAAAKRVAGETYFNMEGQTQVGNNTTDHLAPYMFMTGESSLTIDGDGTVTVQPISLHHETVMYKFVFTLPGNMKFNNSLDFSLMENRVELALLGNSQTYEQRMVKNRTSRVGSGEGLNRTTDHSSISEGDQFRRQILNLRNIEQSTDNTYTFYMAGLPTLAHQGDVLEIVLVMGNDAYITRTEFTQKTYLEAGNVYTIERDFTGTPAGSDGVGDFVLASVFNNRVAALTPSITTSDLTNGYQIASATDMRGLIHALEKGGDMRNTIQLAGSIHVTTDTWIPIGGYDNLNNSDRYKSWRGTFNGNNASGALHGYAISGELRNVNEQDKDKTTMMSEFGLFGSSYFATGGTGTNCRINNVMLTADIHTENSVKVGGILGGINKYGGSLNPVNHEVKNCTFLGSIQARCNNSVGVLYVGGLVGVSQTDGSWTVAFKASQFENNTVKTGYVIGRSPGRIYFGGIVGDMYDQNTVQNNSGGHREEFVDLYSSGAQTVYSNLIGKDTSGSNPDYSLVTPGTP